MNPSCTVCAGKGFRDKAHTSPCLCVWRGVFRTVYGKFKQCAETMHPRAVLLNDSSGPKGRQHYGFRNMDFIADFCLIAKRTLTPQEHMAFKMFFLYGADWTLCAPRVGLTRGLFFHLVYRIEAKLGKALAMVQPYSLYPIDEYFGGCSKAADVSPLDVPDEPHPNGIPLRPPMAPRPLEAPEPEVIVCDTEPEPAAIVLTQPAPALDLVNLADADADIVARQIRAWFAAGRSFRVIVSELNRLNVGRSEGNPWHVLTVRRIVTESARIPKAA